MDISDILELIDEITDFPDDENFEISDFSELREDEVVPSFTTVKSYTVPRIVKW